MALASPDEWYFVYENRLASFQAPQPVKRGASNANSRAPKNSAWPHKSLPPDNFAKAGFFFRPQPNNPDNVVCFLCHKSFDGWEEDDDPLVEHLRHSPSCGWAIVAAVEAEIGDLASVHPLDPVMLDARKATFAGKWPYESKKGFKCKTKQLVEAGWKYTPTNESDDMTTCAYCQLALDGWESGDKPIDEHYKRVPDCPYFVLVSQNPAPKKSRSTKAARASKVSRLSTLSVTTAASDVPTTVEATAAEDDSVMTTESATAQGGKKASRSRKATATKGRKTRAKNDEAVEVVEDEGDLVIPAPSPKPARGRKRTSDMIDDSVVANTEAPSAKKRATQGASGNSGDVSTLTTASQESDVADIPPTKPASRKKGQASAAKRTRQVSGASLKPQASAASLQGRLPDDAEIERQLQADLERSGSDEEDVGTDSDSDPRRTAPAQAPAKSKDRKGTTARKASARSKEEETDDYAMFNPEPVEVDDAEVDKELMALEAEMGAAGQPEPLEIPKKGRKTGTRKVSKRTRVAKGPEAAVPPADPVEEPADNAVVLADPPTVSAPLPLPAPQRDATDPVAVGRLNTSSSTGVSSTGGAHTSTSKRGRGRPSKKKSNASQMAEDEPGGVVTKPPPVDAEPRVEAIKTRDSSPPPRQSPSKIPPATPRTDHVSPVTSAKQATLSPSQSPQSSDAENRPPSSQHITTAKRVVLAPAEVRTPVRGSPSRRNMIAGLRSAAQWTAVDLDMVFSSPGREDGSPIKGDGVERLIRRGAELSTPEKGMTVEEWIYHNAGLAEQKLRNDCEAMVSTFESEGSRAMGVLDGLVID